MKSESCKTSSWRRCGAFVAATVLVAAGCVGARATGSPSLSPSIESGASLTETPPASATASPTASPTDAVPVVDLSSVPLAPSGQWKSIKWVHVPAAPLLAAASGNPDASGIFSDTSNLKVAGWSRGYVGLSMETTTTQLGGDGTTTARAAYSTDGVHWHAGSVLQQHPSTDWMDVRGVYEGPVGLLAVEESGACGDSWVEGLLTSRDGITWQAVDTGKAFGKAVIENVSGGSQGFVATDTNGTKAWTSRDGRTWQPVNLRSSAFALSRIDDGTALSAGYVLAGSTQVTGARSCGATMADPSAKPAPTPPLRLPGVWWSADGTSWVKAQLPGVKAAFPVQMSLCRLDDHTVIAFDMYNQTTSTWAGWVSSDGRTWKTLAQSAGIDPYNYVTDGRHGIELRLLDPSAGDVYAAGRSLLTWTGGTMVALGESGAKPPYDWQTETAVGPTGLLVIDAGQVWIGLPSA